MDRCVVVAALASALVVPMHAVRAQRSVDAAPAGIVMQRREQAPMSRAARPDSTELATPRLWPTFAVGGALLGGAAITTFALAHCDVGCKDDGALGSLPPFILGEIGRAYV